jgi:septal ring factor EnvC (AmiA/AmiB activator)
MKAMPAILFALAITAVIAISMFAIGSNAIVNPSTVPVSNSPNTAPGASASVQQQIDQMQKLINQYQSREQQYQSELSQAAQQLNQVNAQLNQASQSLQMYQQLVQELQNAGVIRITNDGRVFISRGGN